MRSVASFVAFAVISFAANAAAPSEEAIKRCTTMSNAAAAVMKARQRNVSMAQLMAVKSGSTAFDDVMAEIVKDAYKIPAFGTEDFRNNAVQDFENKWFSLCID